MRDCNNDHQLLYGQWQLCFFFSLSLSLHPDTFASKVAAIQDQYADASIGNVTGSNAVNVFLGIGVSPAYLIKDLLIDSYLEKMQ